MATRKSGPLDAMVGARICMLRVNRAISETILAERIGVTFQQMQKYERGANRVGARRLGKSPPCWMFRLASFRNFPAGPVELSGHSARPVLHREAG